jgi:hypothetical protein
MHSSVGVALHTPSVQYGLLVSRSEQLILPAFRNSPFGSLTQYGAAAQL